MNSRTCRAAKPRRRGGGLQRRCGRCRARARACTLASAPARWDHVLSRDVKRFRGGLVFRSHRFHRSKYFPYIRFRGSLFQSAINITTHLLLDVTSSHTCVVIFVEKSYFWKTLAAMRLLFHSTLGSRVRSRRRSTSQMAARSTAPRGDCK